MFIECFQGFDEQMRQVERLKDLPEVVMSDLIIGFFLI